MTDDESRYVRQALGRIEGRLDAIDQRIVDVRQVIVDLDAEHKESRREIYQEIAAVKAQVDTNRASQQADDLRRRRIDLWSNRTWQLIQALIITLVTVALTVNFVR